MKIKIALFSLVGLTLMATSPGCSRTSKVEKQATVSSQGAFNRYADPTLVSNVQSALKARGFDVGEVSGKLNEKTIQAIELFKKSSGLTAASGLDDKTLAALGVPWRGPTGVVATSPMQPPRVSAKTVPTKLTRVQTQALQTALNEKGFNAGKADGIMGANTLRALRAYQRSQKLPETGVADLATTASLGIKPVILPAE